MSPDAIAQFTGLEGVLFAVGVGGGVFIFLFIGLSNIDMPDTSRWMLAALSIYLWGGGVLLMAVLVPAVRVPALVLLIASETVLTIGHIWERRTAHRRPESHGASVRERSPRRQKRDRHAGEKPGRGGRFARVFLVSLLCQAVLFSLWWLVRSWGTSAAVLHASVGAVALIVLAGWFAVVIVRGRRRVDTGTPHR